MAKEVQVTCTEECIGWTEEELDQQLHLNSLSHQAAGMKEVERMVRQKAGEYFASGNDEKARTWREIADLIRERVEKRQAEEKRYRDEYKEA